MEYERKVWTKEQCKVFCMKLIQAGKIIDKAFKVGKITKNRRGRLKTKVSYLWDVYYNKRPDIPEHIKQASNSLYS